MQHLEWTKHGRRYAHADEGKMNTFTYRSKLGERNVDVNGDGAVFAPYVWDPQSNILRFADSELRFTAAGIELWRGKDKLNSLLAAPEAKKDGEWSKPATSVGSLSAKEAKDAGTIEITYPISTAEQDASLVLTAGRGYKIDVQMTINAKQAGEQRLALEFEKEGIRPKVRNPKSGLEVDLPLIVFSDSSVWAWKPSEESDRKIVDSKKIAVGEKVYSAGEKKSIHPDSWGTDVGIAANEDDGSEYGSSWYYNGDLDAGNLLMGNDGSVVCNGGVRWTGVTIPAGATIDSCLIDLYRVSGGGSTIEGKWQAWDADSAGRFSSSNRPSTVTKTTANITHNIAQATNTWVTTPDLKTIVAELLASYTINNDAINFCWTTTLLTGSNYITIQDYCSAGTNEPELTITYTPAGSTYNVTTALSASAGASGSASLGRAGSLSLSASASLSGSENTGKEFVVSFEASAAIAPSNNIEGGFTTELSASAGQTNAAPIAGASIVKTLQGIPLVLLQTIQGIGLS